MENPATYSADSTPQFDEWAIVELFGHQKMAGHVTPGPIGDMLRIDVYDDEETILFTRFVNPKAIYAINPCEKKVAIAVGRAMAAPPIAQWEMRQLMPAPEPEMDEESSGFVGDDDDFAHPIF